MVSVLIGDRELFYDEPASKAGDVIYIDRSIKTPEGGWTRITKIMLGEPVASDAHTRYPLFDQRLCQISAGW